MSLHIEDTVLRRMHELRIQYIVRRTRCFDTLLSSAHTLFRYSTSAHTRAEDTVRRTRCFDEFAAILLVFRYSVFRYSVIPLFRIPRFSRSLFCGLCKA